MSTEPSLPSSGSTPRRFIEPEKPKLGSVHGWTVLGTFVPGLGLWRAGHRIVGSVVMAFALLLIGGLAVVAITQRTLLYSFATNGTVLTWVALALGVLAVGWVVVIGTTHLALRPAGATTGQRLAGGAVVAGLSFLVAAPLAVSANLAYTTSGFVNNVFGDDTGSETTPHIDPVDPWANKDRLNILIIGGDSGNGRDPKLSLRADSNIVASIDTHTGATTLFSLPRQTALMPFPKDSKLHKYFPNGWTDGNPANPDYWLSAMYRFAPHYLPKDVLGKTKHLSEDIMKLSVGEALGLKIDYFVLVNMDGFREVVNALGGITVNVNSPLPIGGRKDANVLPTGWIEPGANKHLDGRLALWYARGRWGYDDYSRAARQRCVINAVAQQANPQNILTNFEKIAAAGEKTVTTDIPQSVLPAMITLAERVKGSKLRSIGLENGVDGFSTLTPNWDLVRKRVQTALKETAKSNPATPTAAPTGSATSPVSGPATSPAVAPPAPSTSAPVSSPLSTRSPSAAPSASAKPTKSAKPAKPKSDDLQSECGYHPNGFKPVGYPNVSKS